MSKKKAPKKKYPKFALEDLDDARAEGFRQARLETFAIVASVNIRNGTSFNVHPSVAKYVLPLVQAAISGWDGSAEWAQAE